MRLLFKPVKHAKPVKHVKPVKPDKPVNPVSGDVRSRGDEDEPREAATEQRRQRRPDVDPQKRVHLLHVGQLKRSRLSGWKID